LIKTPSGNKFPSAVEGAQNVVTWLKRLMAEKVGDAKEADKV
jgi:hypothetical protein